MATFNHLLIPSFIFNLFLMRINDYFMPRSTKGIDNEINTICSPHPSESLESPTAIPASQPTLLVNKTIQDSSLSCSKLSWSWTLPIGLADMEEQEKKAKSHKHQERKVSIHRRQCTSLLIVPMNLMKHFQPEGLSTIFSRCACRAFKNSARQRRNWRSGRNGCGSSCCKETLCKQSISPSCCGTLLFSSLCHQYLKYHPQGMMLLIKEWLLQTCKKRTGEEFKTFGLWYGVPIFTFWHD